MKSNRSILYKQKSVILTIVDGVLHLVLCSVFKIHFTKILLHLLKSYFSSIFIYQFCT